MNIDIKGAGITDLDVYNFGASLRKYHTECGKSMKVAMRMGTIDLIKSLRARTGGTRVSRKTVALKDVYPSEKRPKFVTNKDGHVFRRWTVVRYTKGEKRLVEEFVPSYQKTRGTKARPDVVAQRKSAIENYGQIRRWGLARKSWGWFMKALFNKSAGQSGENPKAEVNSRMVDGAMTERRSASPDGSISLDAPVEVTIDIVNKLSYINEALFPGALKRALEAASRSINEKVRSGIGEAGRGFRRGGHR